MAFWKKSEDPWDIDPNQRRTASEPAEKVPGLLDTLRGGLGRYADGMAGDTGKAETAVGEMPVVRQGHGAGISHGQPRNFLVSGDSKYKNQPFQCAQ